LHFCLFLLVDGPGNGIELLDLVDDVPQERLWVEVQRLVLQLPTRLEAEVVLDDLAEQIEVLVALVVGDLPEVVPQQLQQVLQWIGCWDGGGGELLGNRNQGFFELLPDLVHGSEQQPMHHDVVAVPDLRSFLSHVRVELIEQLISMQHTANPQAQRILYYQLVFEYQLLLPQHLRYCTQNLLLQLIVVDLRHYPLLSTCPRILTAPCPAPAILYAKSSSAASCS